MGIEVFCNECHETSLFYGVTTWGISTCPKCGAQGIVVKDRVIDEIYDYGEYVYLDAVDYGNKTER